MQRGWIVVAGLVLLGVLGVALWGRPLAPPQGPADPDADRDVAPLSSFPGARCAESSEEAALGRAAALVASAVPGEHGVRRDDGVWVLPAAVLDVGHGHGVRFGYAQEGREAYGLLVHGVDEGSVGDALGVAVDDVIGEVDDVVIRSTVQAGEAIAAFRDRGVACVRVLRQGRWRVRWYVLEEQVAADE